MGVEVQGECIQGLGGCRDKVNHWDLPAPGLQPERKLEVKPDADTRARGLDTQLERGSGPSMCGGKRRGVPPLSWLYSPPVLHAILPAVFCLNPLIPSG